MNQQALEPEQMNDQHICKVCCHKFSGKYCNRCGEKVVNPQEKSFRHFLGSLLNAITFLDSKFLKTLKLMVLKPGFVSAQVIEGIRVPYVKPISMFFVINLIYFLMAGSDTYNTRLESQLNQMPYSSMISGVVAQKIEKENISMDVFRVRYEQQSTSLAKLMLIVFVLFTGVFILILNVKKKLYFYDHLTVSLEFNSMFILIGNVVVQWFMFLLIKFMLLMDISLEQYLTDPVYTSFAVIIAVAILYFMQRRVYQDSVVWSLVKALAFIPCLAMSMIAYRAILFFATILTV
ncbi:MAG: DUF3667 domain-containing protein [Cyclobacteriaceae bacterium]|nr:DUF3667 domain-containing protein [Cyclobacteriaceae bacterium]